MLASVRPFDLARGAHRILHELLAAHDHFVPFMQIDIRHANLLQMPVFVHHLARIRSAQVQP